MESEFHCVFPFWLGFYEELPNWKILWRRIFSVETTLGLILFFFFFFFLWRNGKHKKENRILCGIKFYQHKKLNSLLFRHNLQNNIILKLCF